jgi:hypothetical protein
LEEGIARLRSNLNGALMFFHDSLNRVEPEAGSFAHCFGREKRFEDVSFDFG